MQYAFLYLHIDSKKQIWEWLAEVTIGNPQMQQNLIGEEHGQRRHWGGYTVRGIMLVRHIRRRKDACGREVYSVKNFYKSICQLKAWKQKETVNVFLTHVEENKKRTFIWEKGVVRTFS